MSEPKPTENYHPRTSWAPYAKRTGRVNARPRQLEHRLQCACVAWFDLRYPKYLLFAVPNGTAANAIVGAKMVREGVRAGVPDLFLAVPSGGFHGAFFELKTPDGRLSPQQRERIAYLQSHGYHCAVCRTVEAFAREVEMYLNPPR